VSPEEAPITLPPSPLITCLDVDYRPTGAVAAGVWFRGWGAEAAEFEATCVIAEVAAYEPGSFYLRELPCLLKVLEAGPRAEVVVVDGYVSLADDRPGLGWHLHQAIGGTVIGVAKTRYAGAPATAVCRGGSGAPLFVTAIGVSAAEAAGWVAGMHGPFRLPLLLKRVDSLSRSTCKQ